MSHRDSYARFYGLLRLMPGADKESIVLQYTDGRTDSLREMTDDEYRHACMDMWKMAQPSLQRNMAAVEMRRLRSQVLHQMQLYGVDTSNWSRVDGFCTDARIAGKRFCRLDASELEALRTKIIVMRKKNGRYG